MKPYKHQEEIAKEAAELIKKTMIAYLAMEERTGKTLTSILTAEQLNVKDILVITKKKALKGWIDTLKQFKHTKNFKVINYHQAWKLIGDYDLIILDECHNYLSAYPKIGSTARQLAQLRKEGKPNKSIYDAVKRLAKDKPIIYLSATPYAQGPQLLYHQLALSSWSPWRKYPTFYSWFRTFGRPYTIEVHGREVQQYDKCNEDMVIKTVEDLFITKTREELGFEHEPTDCVHYVSLSPNTRSKYNELMEDNMLYLPGATEPLVCDTTMKLRTSLHMLEGGVAKIDTPSCGKMKANYLILDNREKIDFILEKFGDTCNMVIMYNYKAEQTKLEKVFKKAKILQATSYAEGIDLSGYDHLIVYSQDFSTARHTQRRARQCNMKRTKPITVHYILVKKAISHQVYKTVTVNKKNFVDSVFEREEL